MTPREDMIEREIAEHKRSNKDASYAIELRGTKVYLPVIRVNPDNLLLNHKNNRLSGQLKDHPMRANVEADPESTECQALLHTLLARTAKFKDLKKQLDALGQKEPGLIRRDGLLVNGNTRVAALRDLKIGYVEVAVLPPTIDDNDVLDMEMSLQVTDLVHQDYTFTNELLLMRRYLDSGNSPAALAKKMGWIRQGLKKVDTQLRLLSYIEEVRTLSPIPYNVFDTKNQHLQDLDNDYMRLKNQGNVDAAESLKWSRLMMTFLNLNKDNVRAIDENFVDEKLLPRFDSDSQVTKNHLETYRAENVDDGLDDLLGEQSTKTIDMKKVLNDFLNDEGNRDESGGVKKDITSLYANMAFKAKLATENIIYDQKLESANAAPSESLKDTRVKIKTIKQKLHLIMRDPRFKIEKFLFDIDELMDELNALKKEVNDTYD